MYLKIRRKKSEAGFTQLSNLLIRDKRVGLMARGLWLTVLSFPPKWNFTIKGLVSLLPPTHGNGRDAIYRALKELRACGYVKRKRITRQGSVVGYVYTFDETGLGTPSDLPETEKPLTANQTHIKTYSNKTLTSVATTRDMTLRVDPQSRPVEANVSEQVDLPVSNASLLRVSTGSLTPDDGTMDFSWDEMDDAADPQNVLSPVFLSPEKHPSAYGPIPESSLRTMYALCYRAETMQDMKLLSSSQKGLCAKILGQLRDVGGSEMNKLHLFEAWWLQNWRSRDKVTQQYQPPTPNHVLLHWNEAMKSGVRPKAQVMEKEKPVNQLDLTQMMRLRAENKYDR